MKNARLSLLLLPSLALFLIHASSVVAACELAEGQTGVVARVIDGDTLALEDGSEVKLLGLLAPTAPAWWKQERPWPPSEAAIRELAKLTEGQKVELKFDKRRKDGRGRWLAQVYVIGESERIWVQGELAENGAARAHSFADNRACQRELQALEAAARKAEKGLWRSRAYRVVDAIRPETLQPRLQTFQIVEGTVVDVGKTGGWAFLNFSNDWKRDFTAAIARKHAKLFASSDVDLDVLTGRRVRVRGWIERWNGPAIKVTHPEQIEVLEMEVAAPGGDEKTPAPGTPGFQGP